MPDSQKICGEATGYPDRSLHDIVLWASTCKHRYISVDPEKLNEELFSLVMDLARHSLRLEQQIKAINCRDYERNMSSGEIS